MDDRIELAWRYYAEQREQGRSFDSQRSSIGRISLSIAGGLLAYSATQGFDQDTIPLSLFVFLLGVLGVAATQKLYERQEYHYLRARKCLAEIDRLLKKPLLTRIRQESIAEHYTVFKVASRLESRAAWNVLHALVAVSGLGATIYSLLKAAPA